MVLFLTSSPTGPLDNSRIVDGFDDKNHLVENLRRFWREDSCCLMLAADPHDTEFNDILREEMSVILKRRGFSFSSLEIWDDRTKKFNADLVRSFDFILLCGGHVPTQNAFLYKLGMRQSLARFDGIIMGISAGTMNCANMVYAQPELDGESLDPHYSRFIPGLNLTDINVLPHYQMLRDSHLDGRRLFEDITCPDSPGHFFLALPDGSYVLSVNGQETLFGEAWRLHEHGAEKICRDGQTLALGIRRKS